MKKSRFVVSIVLALALLPQLAGAAPAPKPMSAPLDLKPEQVHFSLGDLDQTVHSELQPAVPPSGKPEPILSARPPAVHFRFDKKEEGVTWAARNLLIYPAPAYRELFVQAGKEEGNPIDALKTLLDNGATDLPDRLPVLPPFAAKQLVKARVKLLPFHGGKGIAYLAAYAMRDLPVYREALLYNFQGLTDDGRYWISFDYWVGTPVLPKDPQDPKVQIDPAHYVESLKDTVQVLESPETAYSPELEKLDALVESIEIR